MIKEYILIFTNTYFEAVQIHLYSKRSVICVVNGKRTKKNVLRRFDETSLLTFLVLIYVRIRRYVVRLLNWEWWKKNTEKQTIILDERGVRDPLVAFVQKMNQWKYGHKIWLIRKEKWKK